jgi:hypothetical protein
MMEVRSVTYKNADSTLVDALIDKDDGTALSLVNVDINADAKAPEAIRAWIAAGGVPTVSSEAARQTSIKSDAQRSALLTKLKTATGPQIDTYVQQNVTNIAQAQTMIASILKLIALDVR